MSDLLTTFLTQNGLRFVSIEGDGNCLFRAFSYRIFEDQDRWRDVKTREIELFDRNKAPFPAQLAADLTVDTGAAYVKAANKLGTDAYNGSNDDAYILAKLYNLKLIYVNSEKYNRGTLERIPFKNRVVTSVYNEIEIPYMNEYFNFQNYFAYMRDTIFILSTLGHYDLLYPSRSSSPPRSSATRKLIFSDPAEGAIKLAQSRFGAIVETYEDAVLFNMFFREIN